MNDVSAIFRRLIISDFSDLPPHEKKKNINICQLSNNKSMSMVSIINTLYAASAKSLGRKDAAEDVKTPLDSFFSPRPMLLITDHGFSSTSSTEE